MTISQSIAHEIDGLSAINFHGRVVAVNGLIVSVQVKHTDFGVGSLCCFVISNEKQSFGEIISFEKDIVFVMPYGDLMGITLGCRVDFYSTSFCLSPHQSWLGRTINALGEPIDGYGPITSGVARYSTRSLPLNAHCRARVNQRMDIGIKAINTFLTTCKGQRLGIFSGSGVGKSVLLSMLAKNSQCDVCIIGLVGERGREVREFLEDTLGKEGVKKSIVIVATSDESPLLRRQAAYTTLTIAEYFRDQGMSVLCMIDSVTRFAMAQREIGLSCHEPPTTKGYPPSVFVELPKLLERAGPGSTDREKIGFITAFFTVLVEGDDTNEPISDSVRGILDGHIVLDRAIAERGHFPAININRSVSRTMTVCNSQFEQEITRKARKIISTYENLEDMIRIGAYKTGNDHEADEAIRVYPKLTQFLEQQHWDQSNIELDFEELAKIVSL